MDIPNLSLFNSLGISLLTSDLGAALLSEIHDINYLRFLTDAILLLSPVSLDKTKIVKINIVLLSILVEWSDRLSLTFQSHGADHTKSLVAAVDNLICLTLLAIQNLVNALLGVCSESASLCKAVSNHLSFIQRTIKKKRHFWVSYCGKLKQLINDLAKYVLSCSDNQVSSTNANTATPFPACVDNQKMSYYDLNRLIFREVHGSSVNFTGQPSVQNPNPEWFSRAFRMTGILNIVNEDLNHLQRKLPANQDCTLTPVTPEDITCFQNAQNLLAQLSLHYSALIATVKVHNSPTDNSGELEDGHQSVYQLTLSQVSPKSSKSETCLFDLGNGKVKAKKKVNAVKHLMKKSQFTEFQGPNFTPSSSPKSKSSNRKCIINLHTDGTNIRRVPWTIEESIALWHGVIHYPGTRNWSQIWRQSFRMSNRTQVNLKDRWRVIVNNEKIKECVRRGYANWRSQLLSEGKSGSVIEESAVPIPVIVRSSN